ncbi:putative ankyrin repeat protein RF_0381 [Trichogramma pretiosum]|uniref:putative ankyrin repeat protein RF_0381 n=1 Tax=Trichogramma pretiosum TaxID=7493 RepID=UPI000C71B6F4|nr:putative ankyrin repeat protein RF_0381 [Trichogramma pretiosum]
MFSLMSVAVSNNKHENDELYSAIANKNEQKVAFLLSQNIFDVNRLIGRSEQIEIIRRETSQRINRMDKLEDLDEHLRETLFDKIYSNLNYPVGETYLHVAIKCQAVKIIEILVKHGAKTTARNCTDPNLVTHKGSRPLHLAIRNDSHLMVQLLLQHGADVHAECSEERLLRPIHMAVHKGNFQLVVTLVQNGADVNHCTQLDETPLNIAVAFEHEAIAKFLVKKGANVHNEKDDQMLLHMAVKVRNARIVKLLLENEVNVNIFSDADGWTPLHCAVSERDHEIVDMLINCRALVDQKELYGSQDTTLIMACNTGDIRIVRSILRGRPNIDAYNLWHQTALYLAAARGMKDIVTELLRCNPNPVINQEALSYAIQGCSANHQEIVNILLDHGYSLDSLNLNDHFENSRLIRTVRDATKNGYSNVLRWLLLRAVHPDMHLYDQSGNKLVHYAVPHPDCMRLLIEYGADVRALNNDGQSPMILAVYQCAAETVELLCDAGGVDVSHDTDLFFCVIRKNHPRMFETVARRYRRNLLYRDEYSTTALHLAAWIGNEHFVRTILDMIDAQSEHEREVEMAAEPLHPELEYITPLHCAAFTDRPTIVRMLMDRGHSADVSDGTHNALHLACLYGRIEVVHAILDYEFDVTARDAEDRTLFDLGLVGEKTSLPYPYRYQLFAKEHMLCIPARIERCSANFQCTVYELLVRHLVILQYRHPELEEHQFYGADRNMFVDCYEQSVEQLCEMQSVRVHDRSLQDLVVARRGTLMRYCLNPALRQAYRELIARDGLATFNGYDCITIKKMDIALRRAELYMRGRLLLHEIFPADVPAEIVGHLTSYFKDHELQALIERDEAERLR